MIKTIVLVDPLSFMDEGKQRGLTRTEVIVLSDISQRLWSRWEYQRKINPKLETLKKLTAIAKSEGWL